MNENKIFGQIKEVVLFLKDQKEKPVRIAINGIEGTGKTIFAEKLTRYLNSEKVKAIHVSIDGFHSKKEIRYKQGLNSAKGYYEDAYNEQAFLEKVLKSSQSDIPNYTIAIHDLEHDKNINLEPTIISNDTVLITDGAHLFKPIYRNLWDLKIYLKTSFEIAMKRGIERDKSLLGGFDLTMDKYLKRYHKASKIYIAENKPEEIADIIIDNSNFEDLKILKNSTPKNIIN